MMAKPHRSVGRDRVPALSARSELLVAPARITACVDSDAAASDLDPAYSRCPMSVAATTRGKCGGARCWISGNF